MTKSSEQSSDTTKAAVQLATRHCSELSELCQQDKDNSFPVVVIYFMTFQQLLTQMNNANTQPDTTS